MRSILLALLAALMLAVPLARPVSAVAPPAQPSYGPSSAVTDISDILLSLDEARAAIAMLNAPKLDQFDTLDTHPLSDKFDDSTRFVVTGTGDPDVSMAMGGWVVADGVDEKADYQAAYTALQDWGKKQGGKWLAMPTAAADLAGASESNDAIMVRQEGGQDKHMMTMRLARFGRAIVLISTESDLKASPMTDGDMMGMGLLTDLMYKVVADKAKIA